MACNTPISFKPEGVGGGCQATHRNLTVTYIPRVGILIFKEQKRSKPFVTDTFDIYFLPRDRHFVNFFYKMSKSPPYHGPPPPLPRLASMYSLLREAKPVSGKARQN